MYLTVTIRWKFMKFAEIKYRMTYILRTQPAAYTGGHHKLCHFK